MTLRRAETADAGFVRTLWKRPENARFVTQPAAEEIETATALGNLLIWQDDAGLLGFVLLQEWMPRVYGLMVTAVAASGRGDGERMLRATLDHMFNARDAHRIGLDVTMDNLAALSLYRRLGFQHEGIWRECWQRPGGDWVDCAFMGLLAREWNQ